MYQSLNKYFGNNIVVFTANYRDRYIKEEESVIYRDRDSQKEAAHPEPLFPGSENMVQTENEDLLLVIIITLYFALLDYGTLVFV